MKTEKTIYLDDLNWTSFLWLLGKKQIRQVFLLGDNKRKSILFRLLAKNRRIQWIFPKFHAGDLPYSKGGFCSFQARNTASKVSIPLAEKLVRENCSREELREKHKRKCLTILIAQNIRRDLELVLTKKYVAETISRTRNPICLFADSLFDYKNQKILKNCYFYKSIVHQLLTKFKFLAHFTINLIAIKIFQISPFTISKKKLFINPVLLANEEQVTQKKYERNGIPWKKSSKQKYTILIPCKPLTKKWFQWKKDSALRRELKKKKICFISDCRSLYTKEFYKDRIFALLMQDMKKKFFGSFLGNKNQKVLKLFWYRLLNSALNAWFLCKNNGVRAFVFREPWMIENHGWIYIQEALKINTFMLQYSNIGKFSLNMTSMAKYGCLFSAMYKKIFFNGVYGPYQNIITGYLYHFAKNLTEKRAKNLREKAQKEKIKFLICFFDERICFRRLGFVSVEHMKSIYLSLCKIVLDNPGCGLILKPQFSEFTIQKVLGDRPEYLKASRKKLIFELTSDPTGPGGRNAVFPMEAAQAADICISTKMGGTTAIESALAGCRTVFLDLYETKTDWDNKLNGQNMVFTSLQGLNDALVGLRRGDPQYRKTGDWTNILPGFVAPKPTDLCHEIYERTFGKSCLPKER